jgi:hypothetical protein
LRDSSQFGAEWRQFWVMNWPTKFMKLFPKERLQQAQNYSAKKLFCHLSDYLQCFRIEQHYGPLDNLLRGQFNWPILASGFKVSHAEPIKA